MTPPNPPRHVSLEILKRRIDHHEYVVDPHAVAEALLRSGRLRVPTTGAQSTPGVVSRRGARIRPSAPDARPR
jgi:hypothetical protein